MTLITPPAGVRTVEAALRAAQHASTRSTPAVGDQPEIEGAVGIARIAHIDAVDQHLDVVGVGPSHKDRGRAAHAAGTWTRLRPGASLSTSDRVVCCLRAMSAAVISVMLLATSIILAGRRLAVTTMALRPVESSGGAGALGRLGEGGGRGGRGHGSGQRRGGKQLDHTRNPRAPSRPAGASAQGFRSGGGTRTGGRTAPDTRTEAAPAAVCVAQTEVPCLGQPLDQARATRAGRSPGSRVVTRRAPSQGDGAPVAATRLKSGSHAGRARRSQLQGQPRIGGRRGGPVPCSRKPFRAPARVPAAPSVLVALGYRGFVRSGASPVQGAGDLAA